MKTRYWSYIKKSNALTGEDEDPSCSYRDNFWNKIWALNIPPKIKIFVWKMSLDIIATEANLRRHHVPGNPRCILCGYFQANTRYALLFCQMSRRSWKNTCWWQPLKRLKDLETADILRLMQKRLGKMEFEQFCILCWGIWKDIYKASHKANTQCGPFKMGGPIFGCWMKNYHDEFTAASKVAPLENEPLINKYSRNLNNGSGKGTSIFVDAAYCEDSSSYATGYAIFNNRGRFSCSRIQTY